MGNRAVITTEQKELGVYLHWNGGRDNIEAFLAYCKQRKFRCPENDDYGWARLVQIIANYCGKDGCSIGIELYGKLDTTGDNGVYVIKNWEIIDRINFDGDEQKNALLQIMLKEIDACQPIDQQIFKI